MTYNKKTKKRKEKLLGIKIDRLNRNDVLEKIKKYIRRPSGFFQIISLNPENLVIAQEDNSFKDVVNKGQIRIIDGVGVALAVRLLGIYSGDRFAGVDLMERLIEVASEIRLRVLLIGGKENLAEKLSHCQKRLFPKASFLGLRGIEDIRNPKKSEEDKIFSIVADFKPHIVFVAFGSPNQELWLWKYRQKFEKTVVMGVGGAFNYLGGEIKRAPRWLRDVGLEWIFRLLNQPWRWRRQLRLVKFAYLVIKEKFSSIF